MVAVLQNTCGDAGCCYFRSLVGAISRSLKKKMIGVFGRGELESELFKQTKLFYEIITIHNTSAVSSTD